MKDKNQLVKRHLKAAATGLALGALSLGVNAGNFPNDPLQTGAGLVPPNIMFILDNSGSMAESVMPIFGRGPTTPVDITRRAIEKNSLGYDSATTYAPWDTVDSNGGNLLVAGGNTISAVYTDPDRAISPTNIAGTGEAVFYVLRDSGAPDAVTSYDRYWIDAVGTMYKAAVTGTRLAINEGAVQDTGAGGYRTYSVSFTNANEPYSIYLLTNGSTTGDADLYVTTDGTTAWPNNYQCASAGPTSAESCTVEVVGSGTINITVRAYSGFTGLRLRADAANLGGATAATPTGRANEAEVANYATWYSFHRTRMKTAKAGASRAFVNLGSGYRVGLDTINDSNGNPRTDIRYEIPTNTNRGRFEGQNRSDWFTILQNRVSNGGTPLRSALKRTGEYYRTSSPWADGSGTDEQKCRASYAMLTTDGYWNSDDGFSIGNAMPIGGSSDDKDGDGYANTLADVAYYYYENDLRPSLDNNVPTTPTDNKRTQHMSLFGVSIGLRGTTPVSDTPPTTWPDPTDQEDSDRIDDLWHAAVNAHGPKLIVASKSDEYANAVRGALNQIKDQRASGSNITSNGNSLNNGAQLFQAMFISPAWSGDVMAYDLTRGGIAATPDWSMGQVANANPTEFKNRPILTTFNGSAAVFDAAHIPNTFVGRTGASAVTRDDNIAYVKGERMYEMKNASLLATPTERAKAVLRDRISPIGDIVNSSPFYQRQVNSMFIAANDGMLHGVDAISGRVLMSYVPKGIDFAALSNLSNPFYAHNFFVDGQIDVSDTGQGNGRNILAASLGRGGKGIFALDVGSINTHDTNGAYTGTFTTSNVLFDASGNADSEMGYVAQQPLVRMGNNNAPVIITGNGFESATGKAYLYAYSTTGAVLAKIKVSDATGNGLSQVSVADINNDDAIDVAYAGDLLGNVWKFDLSNSDPGRWKVALASGNGSNATPVPLFTATDGTTAQPITGGIVVTRQPGTGKIFLSFGTGRFLYSGDVVSSAVQQTQTIYGLIDESAPISGRADLQARTFPYVGVDSLGRPARGLENYGTLASDKKGWYLDLGNNANTWSRGERVVTTPALDGSAVWVSSIIPLLGTSCEATGRGYVNVINIFTGTNPENGGYFDVNGNGVADDAVSTGSNTSGGRVSSVDLGVAMPGAPAIVDNKVAVLGSNSNIASVDALGGGIKTKRLMWREIVNLD